MAYCNDFVVKIYVLGVKDYKYDDAKNTRSFKMAAKMAAINKFTLFLCLNGLQ